jgi:hypothetical protein
MAVPIVVKGAAVEPGLPIARFQPRIVFGGTQPIGYLQQYDVAPDGRFLINVNTDEGSAEPITVIEHWKPSN